MINKIAEHFSLALSVLSIIALWVGLMSSGRKTRGKSWYCMIIGGVLYTTSILLKIWWEIERARAPGSWLHMDHQTRAHLTSIGLAVNITAIYGLVLFFIGFALHHLRSSKLEQRITELEMMNLAQATELERLRNR